MNKKSQKGFSLVELAIAVVVLAIIALAITQVMFSSGASSEQRETQLQAMAASEEVMESLTALTAAQLPDGGSFTPAPDKKINAQGCSPATCDFVLSPAVSPTLATSPAKGVPWSANYQPPSGFRVKFIRRWLVETLNAELQVRRITVAVAEKENSDTPLSLQTTRIGLTR